MKRFQLPLLILILSATSLGFVTNVSDNYFEISKNLTIFGKLYREINTLYVDEPDPTKLMREGIDAMLASLDPYTNYISAGEVEDFRIKTSGQYCGIGVTVSEREGRVLITEGYEGDPAVEAGVKVGDEIIMIDNEQVKGKSKTQQDIRTLLRGQAGTPVVLTILREGESEPRKITVTRKDIKVDNVTYYGMVNENVGYIALTGFTQEAGKEVREAFEKLKRDNPKMKGVVLDLRNNLGGLLHEAVNVASVFVKNNEMVVETRGREESSQKKYYTRENPVDTIMPVSVLINSHSASASEIVVGALQDLDRAVVVGQRSFGKGLVQTTRPLVYESQLKLTTAKYYIPSGRCVQALDYSHRSADGAVGKVADSLKKAFRTRNGRAVFDGGGVDADIEVKPTPYNTVTNELISQGIIFDFVTKYASKSPKIADSRTFKVTDEMYADFIKYVEGRNFKYETPAEKELAKLKDLIESEHHFENIAAEYKQLDNKIKQLKNNELMLNRKDIAKEMEIEVIKRYFYRRGMIEASFNHDEVLKTAVDVLTNDAKYKKVLAKK